MNAAQRRRYRRIQAKVLARVDVIGDDEERGRAFVLSREFAKLTKHLPTHALRFRIRAMREEFRLTRIRLSPRKTTP